MKKNLCVIFGGESPEHDISQKSVTSVLYNLNKDKYNIYTLGITKDGKWYLYSGQWDKIEVGEWEKETRQINRNLRDLIQILLIRELLRRRRPGRPPMPPRPPMPGPGPRPPMRPPFGPQFNRNYQNLNKDFFEY